MLGDAVYNAYKTSGHTVLGLANSRATGELQQLDLLNATAVEEAFSDFKPDCEFRMFDRLCACHGFLGVGVIHCAAERRPDVAQQVMISFVPS